MSKVKTKKETLTLKDAIIKGLQELKGENIVVIDLSNLENTVCQSFIICTGNSNTHVNGLTGAVEKIVKELLKEKPWHIEGAENAEWVLMDYVDTVVHIFQPETREFYNLEELWADGKITQVKEA